MSYLEELAEEKRKLETEMNIILNSHAYLNQDNLELVRKLDSAISMIEKKIAWTKQLRGEDEPKSFT